MLRSAGNCASNSGMPHGRDIAVNDATKTRRRMVRASDGQTDYKRELAYQRLGINPEDVDYVPYLNANLRRIARCVRGVDTDRPPAEPVRALDFLQSSEDPEARKVADVYRSVPASYRRLLPAEAYCLAAGVSPWRVLEMITVVAVRQAGQASAIVASLLHPRVVAKSVERALQDEGTRERMMLHRAMGFTATLSATAGQLTGPR
jgi:hypothetical protein